MVGSLETSLQQPNPNSPLIVHTPAVTINNAMPPVMTPRMREFIQNEQRVMEQPPEIQEINPIKESPEPDEPNEQGLIVLPELDFENEVQEMENMIFENDKMINQEYYSQQVQHLQNKTPTRYIDDLVGSSNKRYKHHSIAHSLDKR